MVQEIVYSPHYDFFIDKAHRAAGYDMNTFHMHKKYEVYYQTQGTRRYYINDSAYLINAGSLVLIGPDEVHKTSSEGNSAHVRFVINFSRAYLESLFAVFPDVDFFSCFETGVHVVNVPLKQQALIESAFQMLYDTRDDALATASAERQLVLSNLLLTSKKLVSTARSESLAETRISNKTIDKIQSYISTHYADSFTLAQIAAQFYISPYYLSHLFKKTTNLSVVEYINSVRLTAAKNYFENTDFKITSVAEDTGFSTTAHFSRVFKEGTGLSPQQYRKFYRTEKNKE